MVRDRGNMVMICASEMVRMCWQDGEPSKMVSGDSKMVSGAV